MLVEARFLKKLYTQNKIEKINFNFDTLKLKSILISFLVTLPSSQPVLTH